MINKMTAENSIRRRVRVLTKIALLAVLGLMLSGLEPALAAVKTFTGPGNFSTAALWNGGTLPAAGDSLRINGTCTFDNGAANLAYGTLNVGFGAVGTLNWPAGGTNTLNVTTVSSTTAGSAINMTDRKSVV